MTTLYDVVIIGAGAAGLSAAYRLGQAGQRVLVVEAREELGGLAGCVVRPGYAIERYYHHAFSGDSVLFRFLRELDLYGDLVPCRGTVGYFFDHTIYPLNTPFEILRFPHLTFAEKIRLGILTLRARGAPEGGDLDQRSAAEWLEELGGRRLYDVFFAPLLRGKFGERQADISAAWMASRIRLRSNRGLRGERLFYLRGSFQSLFRRLGEAVRALGGEVRTSCPVSELRFAPQGGVTVVAGGAELSARRVVSTMAPEQLRRVAPDLPPGLKTALGSVPYQACLCLLICLQRGLSPCYWTNIARGDLPFSLMVEHNHLYSNPAYEGRLIYLASYYSRPDHPAMLAADADLVTRHLEALESLFGVKPDQVVWTEVSKSAYSGPIYIKGLARAYLPARSPVKGLYLAGMLQSYPERSINDSLYRGELAARAILEERTG